MFSLEMIKPEVSKASDKYSWNLHQYLKKYPAARSVFYIGDRPFDQEFFYPSDLIVGEYIARSGDLIGSALNEIIRDGSKVTQFCFTPKTDSPQHYKDITELFWTHYLREGRCFLFGHDCRLYGDSDRFVISEDGESRTCNWCRVTQTKHRKEVVVIEESWV